MYGYTGNIGVNIPVPAYPPVIPPFQSPYFLLVSVGELPQVRGNI
jgi:hypothetical protein